MISVRLCLISISYYLHYYIRCQCKRSTAQSLQMLVSAWKEEFDLLFESLIESIGPSKPPWNFSTEDADSYQAATPF